MGNSLTKSLDNIMARTKPLTKIKQPEIVVVSSGKGGVGKTFLSVNLALMWQRLGKKVLLIDADFHLGNADLILGITTERSIADVILNKVDLADVITAGPGGIDHLRHRLSAYVEEARPMRLLSGALEAVKRVAN